MNYIGYHATDKYWLNSILTDGFQIRPNPRHWMGNGVYYFPDEELARWWALNKPSQKFGSPYIEGPCVIRSEISSEGIMDCTKLKNHKRLSELFSFYQKVLVGSLKKLPDGSDYEPTDEEFDIYRCKFFNWVYQWYGLDGMIVWFCSDGSDYLTDISLQDLKIPFVETQMCIVNTSCITFSEEYPIL